MKRSRCFSPKLKLGHFIALAAGILGLAAPTSAFTPYRLILQAARSPENPMAFVEDKRLKTKMRRALLVAEPESALTVEPYVAGGHGYLIGWVKDRAERQRLEDAVRGVQGLISLAIYMPTRPTGAQTPSRTAELKLEASVRLALRSEMGAETTNIDVRILGNHAILIGVLGSSAEIEQAAKTARQTSGVGGVTSFLSIPLSGDAKRIGILR